MTHDTIRKRAVARAIISTIATFHGVTPAEMRGLRRERHVAWPRQEAAWILRLRTTLSSPAIGRLLDRDHSTVLTAITAVERRRHHDADYRLKTDALLAMVDRVIDGSGLGQDADGQAVADPLAPIQRQLAQCHARLTETLAALETARADIAVIQHHGGR